MNIILVKSATNVFSLAYFVCILGLTSSQHHGNYLNYDEDFLTNEHHFYNNEELFVPNENVHDYERTIDLGTLDQKIDGKLAQLLNKGQLKLGLFNDFVSAVNNTIGVDMIRILDGLLSPEGVLSQFVLSLAIQSCYVGGYVISGIIYYLAVESTTGATQDAVKELDFLFNASSIAKTLVRGLIGVVWELGARTITTFVLFGVFETVNQILATTTVQGLWNFITSTQLKRLMIGRFLAATAFIIIGFVLLNQLGMAPVGNLAIGREARDPSSWLLITSL